MSMQHDQRGEDGSGMMKDAPGLMNNCATTMLVLLALIGAGVIFFYVVCSIAESRSLVHMH